MLECDDITIELSREQAVSSNGNATWTNQIPPLILNEGDKIICQGGWISVSNSGDNSIEIFDEIDTTNNSVNASFFVSYYKTMDTKNVVSFPYHSMKLTEEENDLIGCGFKQPLNIGEYPSPTIEDYDSEEYTDYNISHYCNVPLLTYDEGENYDQNLTECSTYSNLLNDKDGDKFNSDNETYTDFLINTSLKQGHRDLCNTGNYFTALYRKTNGQYDLLQREVEVSIPKGYYSPVNLATYITEQLQTKYFNKQIGKVTETWTNQGRYVIGMTPVAVPNLNESLFYGDVGDALVDFVSLNSNPFIGDAPSISIQTGLSKVFKNVLITDVKAGRFFQGTSVLYFLSFLEIEIIPTDEKDKNDLDYIKYMANEVSGQGTDFQTKSNETIYQNQQGLEGNDGFRLSIIFLINSILYNIVNSSGVVTGQATNQALWGGYIAQDDVFPVGNPFYENPLTKAVTYVEPTEDKPLGSYKIIVTTQLYQPSIYALDASAQYQVFATSYDSILIDNTWLSNDQVLSFKQDYPDGFPLNADVVISVGGNPRVNTKFSPASEIYSNRLPLGVPIYGGSPRFYENLTDPAFFKSLLINDNSLFSWSPVSNKVRMTNDYQPDPNEADFNENITLPISSLNFSEKGSIKMDFKNGNKYMGSTAMNWNRWTLRNWEEPPKVEDPSKDEDVMPILRKYPLFMKYGMLTNVGQITEEEGDKIYGDGDQIYPDIPDLDLSIINFTELNQEGNILFTNQDYRTIQSNGASVIDNWYNFIQGQIDDGLIDIDLGTHTYNGYDYFYAYTHFCMSYNEDIKNSFGSDIAIRNRPRGLIVRIHKDSFINKSVIYTGKARYFKDGFVMSNNGKLGCNLYSWINDKIMTKTGLYENNFGFKDYNIVPEGATTINLDSTLQELYNQNISLGWGYSYCKMGWRNFTSLLVSYSMEEADATDMMFNAYGNRMDKNSSKYNPNNIDATNWGSLSYNPRIYLGADSSSLNFDDDGSSRFYFSNMFITNKISNKYYEGTSNNDGGNLQPSIQKPFYNAFGGTTIGISETPQENAEPTFGEDLPENTNAGLEIIQYNKTKRDIYNDALFQLAPEISKHIPIITTIKPAFTSNPSIQNAEQGNYITGNWFGNMFPIDTNLDNRFFCFDQDCRHHTFNVGTYTFNHTTLYDFNLDSGDFSSFGNPDPAGIVINEWDEYNGTYTGTDTIIASKFFTPSNFWGCFSGEQGFIEKVNEAGTIRPDPSVIYDSLSGIQIYDWGQYNRTNWDKSFWNMIGFNLEDLMATPFQYCSQQRNFTTNFMTQSTELFRTHSYPMRQDADLTDSGFVSVNGNIQGYLQYTLQYPRTNIISSTGLQGINNLEQNVYVYQGGINQPSTNTFPYQFDAFIPVNLNEAGASYLNGQLISNEFVIAYTESTKNYASIVPSKLESPFYLIRSNLPDDNYKYTNNAEIPSVLPILAVISKQYGATGDWYYSGDSVNMNFTNKRKRVLTEIRIQITEKNGKPANTIEDKSTIFVKIIRANPTEIEGNTDPTIEDIEMEMDKKQQKIYQDEIKELIRGI